jgi:hypothetical protein
MRLYLNRWLGRIACAYHPSYKDCSPGLSEHKARPYLKNNQYEKGWQNDSSAIALLSKHEALSSNPSTTKKEKKKGNGRYNQRTRRNKK